MLKVLFAEEAAGRDRSALATRRAAAGFPTGKTFDAWQPEVSSIPAPTQQALRTLEQAMEKGDAQALEDMLTLASETRAHWRMGAQRPSKPR